MKLERMIYILLALLAKRQIKAKDLAETFQVSTRTIYRDLDSLSLAGVPIYSERGDKGGFYIPDDYKLDKTFFTQEEKDLVLNISRTISQILGHKQAAPLEHKLASLHLGASQSPYYFDFDSWEIDRTYLQQLDQALEEKRLLYFRYLSKKQETSQRSLVPYHLVFKLNAWYIFGYCLTRKDFRFFKLSRMRELRLSETSFDPAAYPSLDLADLEAKLNPDLSSFKPFKEEVELEFSKGALPRLYDYFKQEEIDEQEQIILVKCQRALDRTFLQTLLSFGQTLKVRKPAKLRQQILEDLQKNLEQYDSL
ncbi:helix-turn-helix transcriptional regulator [Streptococcus oricebi]|uniref:YafY family transcriptional regulator n=1 Tax=Streptococcus oricebi TaxID=1547447 RepID=A0ABS5B232_9STRE|nr:YafY family protein [Streptococcus oricebi]MBP2622571.1 YafY family transcriptional regulator [Streptococcus oricebi]